VAAGRCSAADRATQIERFDNTFHTGVDELVLDIDAPDSAASSGTVQLSYDLQVLQHSFRHVAAPFKLEDVTLGAKQQPVFE
jgi:hypothetical protein